MTASSAVPALFADIVPTGIGGAAGRDDSDPGARLVFGVLGLLGGAAGLAAFTGHWRGWVDDVRKTFFALSGPGYALFFLPYATGTFDLPERSLAWTLLGVVPIGVGMVWVAMCFVLAAVFEFARPRWMQPPWLRRSQALPRDVLVAKARRGRGAPLDTGTVPMEITAGQLWRYRTRPGEHASRARVLLVEDHPTLGPVVHVRLEDLQVSNPHAQSGSSTWLGHVPVTRQAFEASVIAVVGGEDSLPDLQGVHLWRADRGGAFTTTLAEVVSTVEATLTGARP